MHRWVVAAAIAVVGLVRGGASGASADPVALGGSPLNVYVGERGQLQAFRQGSADGIYYRSTSTTGDAGFFLAVPGAPGTVYGFDGNAGPTAPPTTRPVSRGSRSRAAARRQTR